MVAEQLNQLPPAAFKAMGTQQFQKLSLTTFAGMTSQQMDALTVSLAKLLTTEALDYITPDALSGMSQVVAASLSTAQLQSLTPEQKVVIPAR